MAAKSSANQAAACCGGQAVRLGHKVRDPLCGMSVDADSPHRLEEEGRSLRFCGESCRADYARALRGESVPGVAFTCVMHPEGRQERPGECAVCGMALVPARTAAAGHGAQRPGGGVLRRVWAALGLRPADGGAGAAPSSRK